MTPLRRSPARRRVLVVAASLAVLVLGALTATHDPGGGDDLAAGEGLVRRVVDGDTVEVQLAGGRESVRLLGIDTPESVAPDRPVECFGPEASRRTQALLPPGTRIRLERDVEARDHYGRLLAHVHRSEDGLHVNLTLVEEGFAETLTIAPNRAYATVLAAAAAEARRTGRGLWGACGTRTGR